MGRGAGSLKHNLAVLLMTFNSSELLFLRLSPWGFRAGDCVEVFLHSHGAENEDSPSFTGASVFSWI